MASAADDQDGPEVTPEMIEAGVAFVKGFYPAEWGGRAGIGDYEAGALVKGLLAAIAEHAPWRISS